MRKLLAIILAFSVSANAESYFNPWKSFHVSLSVKKGQSVETAVNSAILNIKKSKPLEYEKFLSKLKITVDKNIVVQVDALELDDQPLGVLVSKLCTTFDSGFILDDDQLKIFHLTPRDDFYFLSDIVKKRFPNEKVLRIYLKGEGIAEDGQIEVDAAVSVIKLRGIEKAHENMKNALEKIR